MCTSQDCQRRTSSAFCSAAVSLEHPAIHNFHHVCSPEVGRCVNQAQEACAPHAHLYWPCCAAEIDKTMKKIDEGLTAYDALWEEVSMAPAGLRGPLSARRFLHETPAHLCCCRPWRLTPPSATG